jgi:hypothetical protein
VGELVLLFTLRRKVSHVKQGTRRLEHEICWDILRGVLISSSDAIGRKESHSSSVLRAVRSFVHSVIITDSVIQRIFSRLLEHEM